MLTNPSRGTLCQQASLAVPAPLKLQVMRHVELALRPSETELTGEWYVSAIGVVADETSKRIEVLAASVLKRLGSDASGWESLFQDPNDGRLWELYYPESEMHGWGGA